MKELELFGKKYPYKVSISVLKSYSERAESDDVNMVALAVDVIHRALKSGQADRPFWKKNVPGKKKIESGMTLKELMEIINKEFGEELGLKGEGKEKP